eukprot:2759662-Rhodomonas_salina.1
MPVRRKAPGRGLCARGRASEPTAHGQTRVTPTLSPRDLRYPRSRGPGSTVYGLRSTVQNPGSTFWGLGSRV